MRLAVLTLPLLLLTSACEQGKPDAATPGVLPDGARYQGALQQGRLEGPGRLDYPNGSWYQGGFAQGRFSGQGEWRGTDGTRYQGAFREGQYDGEGQLDLADGSHYKGHFAKGLFNGQGERDDGLGNHYSGEFRDGHLQGEGHFNDGDGNQYQGQFKDDQFSGAGHFQNSDGDVWTGQFADGELSGAGTFVSADGERYEGHFEHWQFSGQGRWSGADGDSYEGQFDDGRYAGEGTLRHADGRVEQGTWVDGERRRDEHGRWLTSPVEESLLAQGPLLDRALAAVPRSTPAAELYGLVVAGDGEQSVFLREADYVSRMLDEHFGARGRITLVNHRDHLSDRPMATHASLQRAIRTLAERTGPEDLIFLYFTSHGSHDHHLVLDAPGLSLDDLPAQDLAELLAPLKNRDKVLVISACYSGGFIPPIKDAHTLIMTAARADRVSFGCSEEADFTYFGDALFAQALQHTDNLQQAFAQASRIVAEREKAEGFEPSEPQIWAPQAVLQRWRAVRNGHGVAAKR
ncbi:MAG: hypothetical protein GAK45_02328 [Pseudomonas citronellolis]|nr:MAG: hypothetical protein GAK45_02328 [Pseudomonas citronellolis]